MSSLSMQAWIADAAYSRTAARPSGARCGCCHGAQRGARVLQGLSATPRSCGTSGCADEAEDHWAFL